MDFYVKNESDELIKATIEQVMSPDEILFDVDGKALNPKKTEAISPIDNLTNVVTDLAKNMGNFKGSLDGVKEKAEQMEEQIAAYKETSKAGFPIGAKAEEVKVNDKLVNGYVKATQGKALLDRFKSAKNIAPEVKDEMADYFTLFVKASFLGDIKSLIKMQEKYPVLDKTAIGDSGNAFTVPNIIESEILHFARERSNVLQYASTPTMVSDKQTYNAESGGVNVYWGTTTQASDPTAADVELDAEILSAYATVMDTTLADSSSDIVSWISGLMAEAIGQELDNVCFNGDGTSTYASVSGILSAACGYSVAMGSGSTTFAQMDGVVLSEMISKLDGLKKEGAMFWMNGSVLHYLRTLQDTTGRPIFMDGHYGDNVPPTVLGYPYREVIKMPSTTAANTAFVNFGNLKYYYAGKRLGTMQLKVNNQAETPFLTNRTWFKIINRWGQKIGLENGFVRLLTAAS